MILRDQAYRRSEPTVQRALPCAGWNREAMRVRLRSVKLERIAARTRRNPALLAITALLVLLLPAVRARAWNDQGHMAIAYLAFRRLRPAVRLRVKALLK